MIQLTVIKYADMNNTASFHLCIIFNLFVFRIVRHYYAVKCLNCVI